MFKEIQWRNDFRSGEDESSRQLTDQFLRLYSITHKPKPVTAQQRSDVSSKINTRPQMAVVHNTSVTRISPTLTTGISWTKTTLAALTNPTISVSKNCITAIFLICTLTVPKYWIIRADNQLFGKQWQQLKMVNFEKITKFFKNFGKLLKQTKTVI